MRDGGAFNGQTHNHSPNSRICQPSFHFDRNTKTSKFCIEYDRHSILTEKQNQKSCVEYQAIFFTKLQENTSSASRHLDIPFVTLTFSLLMHPIRIWPPQARVPTPRRIERRCDCCAPSRRSSRIAPRLCTRTRRVRFGGRCGQSISGVGIFNNEPHFFVFATIRSFFARVEYQRHMILFFSLQNVCEELSD